MDQNDSISSFEVLDLCNTDGYQQIKAKLHRHLIEQIEEEAAPVQQWHRQRLNEYINNHCNEWFHRQSLPLNRNEARQLVGEMVDELVGFGPIQRLIDDNSVDDILVNGPSNVFVERGGQLKRTSQRFIDDSHVVRIMQRIVAPLGRRIDEANPMVDARLPDGSRVNAIIPPLALDGPCLSIRKFPKERLRGSDLLVYRSLDSAMLELLNTAVRGRCNLIVSGGTGAGKTTLLNVLSQSILADERLITIEDAAELDLGHAHVVRLETRPPNLEGNGEVGARELMRNALRMRPDRIILGEVRGVEVLDMLQAMNTGHEGSMTTVHANSARDALDRLEMLIGFTGFKGDQQTLRQWIASAIDIIVQIGRMPDGSRRILHIHEVIGMSDTRIQLQEIFAYDSVGDRFIRHVQIPNNHRFRRGKGLGVTTSEGASFHG